MKTRVLACAAIALSAVALLLNSVSEAQQAQSRARAVEANRPPINRPGDQSVGVLDEQTTGANIRASQLMGMDIQNSEGEGVGEVEDLVIDGNSGQVRYVAVTYGGFLGLGDKLFAVPFEAFRVTQEEGDEDEFVLTLNVTQKQLEGAEGFDQEKWPNFADRNFTNELDRRYGIDRSVRQATRPGQDRLDGTRDNLNNQNRINNNQRNLDNQNRINNDQSDVNNQNNLNGDIGADQNQNG